MRVINRATGAEVEADRAKEGSVVDGVRAKLGDWIVDGKLVAAQDFVDRYVMPTQRKGE